MDKKVLLVDIDLCYGCLACEVACKQEHDLPVGPCWISVQKIGPQKVDGKLKYMMKMELHYLHQICHLRVNHHVNTYLNTLQL